MKDARKVSIIGLGQMGFTLAQLLLKEDYQVTVWNRSPEKADALIKQGASWAENAAAAIEASPVTVICVFDYKASDSILKNEQVTKQLHGRTLVQLTTGSPDDALQSEAWVSKHGTDYIDGAIQVAPEQMARPDTTIFFSGKEQAFKTVEPILRIFGGNLKYLGNRISAAAAMDLASLSYLYGSLLGFFHAARIAEAEGFDMNVLGEIIREISPGFAEFIQYEAGVIQSGDYKITQSPLAISVEATDRIYKASQAYHINTEVPRLARDFFRRGSESNLANQELAALIKVFRN